MTCLLSQTQLVITTGGTVLNKALAGILLWRADWLLEDMTS
jgi:hypothetical protein